MNWKHTGWHSFENCKHLTLHMREDAIDGHRFYECIECDAPIFTTNKESHRTDPSHQEERLEDCKNGNHYAMSPYKSCPCGRIKFHPTVFTYEPTEESTPPKEPEKVKGFKKYLENYIQDVNNGYFEPMTISKGEFLSMIDMLNTHARELSTLKQQLNEKGK